MTWLVGVLYVLGAVSTVLAMWAADYRLGSPIAWAWVAMWPVLIVVVVGLGVFYRYPVRFRVARASGLNKLIQYGWRPRGFYGIVVRGCSVGVIAWTRTSTPPVEN